MLWLSYPDAFVREEALHAKHSFARKFCGCMSLRGGCAIACAIWAGLNLYLAILAFQSRSPIYSHLNTNALMILGAICLMFVLIAIMGLLSLFADSPRLLHWTHRSTWLIVCVFLADYFGNMILYGVQVTEFQTWCLAYSRNLVDERITNTNGTEIPMVDSSPEIYNCRKLWQDELKLSITVFILLSVCYLYWATCLWSYAQKIILVNREAAAILARGPPPMPLHPPPPPQPPMMRSVMNLKPKDLEDSAQTQQSGVQLVRRLWQYIRQRA